MNQVITKEEITDAIKALKVGKAVGIDDITGGIVKRIAGSFDKSFNIFS